MKIAALLGMLLAGCGHAQLRMWDAGERQGAVTVPLCAPCGEPFGYQQESAQELMQKKCEADVPAVSKEGIIVGPQIPYAMGWSGSSANAYANRYTAQAETKSSSSFVSGSYAERFYYWLFGCREPRPSDAKKLERPHSSPAPVNNPASPYHY